MIKREQRNQGITLVALIITIIILIILAAVTINAAFKVNIINVASNGAEKYQEEQYREKEEFDKLNDLLQDFLSKNEENEEPKVEPTGIYTALVGNTLKFYITEAAAIASGGKTYRNVKGETFTRDNTNGIESPTTPWFEDKEKITKVEFVDEVAPEYMAYFFSDLENLETVDMRKVKTVNVTDMYGMFNGCSSITKLNIESFNTQNVTNMQNMFSGCSSLTELNIGNFDTQNVTNMRYMFYGLSITELNIKNFDTRNVTVQDMEGMFQYCTNLTKIYVGANWEDTKNSENMFLGCGTNTTERI